MIIINLTTFSKYLVKPLQLNYSTPKKQAPFALVNYPPLKSRISLLNLDAFLQKK